jgi:hypothetical protein
LFLVVVWLQSHKLKTEKSFTFVVKILKFLVIGKGVDYGGPANPADLAMAFEYVILPSIQMVKEWEEKKMVVGGLFAGQRAGVIILDAPSAEELSSWLQQLPFWGQNSWEVVPLQSFASGVEDVKRQIANMKKMAEMAGAMPK